MSEKQKSADERPPAPWGSFPLSELMVLSGIVMLVIGFASSSPVAVAVGVALAALGGMEVSVREHLAGYRSHSTLLAGAVFVFVTGALLYLAGLPPAVSVGMGVLAFVAAFLLLRRAFRRASGGLSFRVGGLRG